MANKKVFEIEIDGVKQSIVNVNQLKQAQEELAAAFENADFGSENYARLATQLQDVNSRLAVIDESVADITAAEKVEGFVRFGSAIGGAFATATTAAQAFGASGAEIEALQTKFAVLISTLETLQLVQEAVGKENKLFTSFINKFATDADNSYKKAGLAARLFGSTTRAAVAATGIGLLVILLATVITNFDKIKAKAVEFLKSFEPINKAITYFEEKIGGIPQLFSGVLSAAKEVFVQVGRLAVDAGKIIASLFTSDSTSAAFDKLLSDASEFGSKVGAAFSQGVADKQAEIAQEAANKQLQLLIDQNNRALKIQQAYGNDTFALRKKILQQEYDLIVGQQKLLDKESQEYADKEKERLDKLNEIQILQIEQQNARIAARFEALKRLLEKVGDGIKPINVINGFEVKTSDNAEEKLQKQIKADIEKALSKVKIEPVSFTLKPTADTRSFFKKLDDEIRDFTDSNKFQEFATKATNAISEGVGAISGITSGLTGLFQAQLKNVEDQIARIQEGVQLTDQQIAESQSKSEEAENKLATATGARREYLIAKIEEEKKKEASLNAAKFKAAKEQEKLEKEAAKRRENLAKAEKAIQIGQAISNTALAVIKFLANPGGFPGIALSVAAGITGALQIATIAAQKFALGGVLPEVKKLFNRGGMLSGPSHEGGGIPFSVGGRVGFEAEGGEVIVNKKSSAKFRKELSDINSYNGWGVRFATGGITPTNVTQPAPIVNNTFSMDALIEEQRLTRQAIAGINIRPVVDVKQVTDAQATIVEVVQNATI